MNEVEAYVYELGKEHPVAVVMKDGREVSLDPWDVEEMERDSGRVRVRD